MFWLRVFEGARQGLERGSASLQPAGAILRQELADRRGRTDQVIDAETNDGGPGDKDQVSRLDTETWPYSYP